MWFRKSKFQKTAGQRALADIRKDVERIDKHGVVEVVCLNPAIYELLLSEGLIYESKEVKSHNAHRKEYDGMRKGYCDKLAKVSPTLMVCDENVIDWFLPRTRLVWRYG